MWAMAERICPRRAEGGHQLALLVDVGRWRVGRDRAVLPSALDALQQLSRGIWRDAFPVSVQQG